MSNQPIPPKTSLTTDTELIPLEQSAYFNEYTDEEKLKHYMTQVYEFLDKVRPLIPFFKAVVEWKGCKYWAELEMHKNPMSYPDVAQYHFQAYFGLPNAHGFFYDLYQLDRSGLRPFLNKSNEKVAGNMFDKSKEIIRHPVRVEELKVIQKIC